MTNKDDSLTQDLRDHPLFPDEDKMWKDAFIVGRMDGVLVPTREELLVLFEHWYLEALASWLLQIEYSNGEQRRCKYAYRRLGLIDKCLPKKEVNALIKRLRESGRRAEKDGSREKEIAQDATMKDLFPETNRP